MQRDRQAASGRAQHGDTTGLGGAHDGGHVVLAEHPLHGHCIGAKPIQPLLELAFQLHQTVAEGRVDPCADGADVDES